MSREITMPQLGFTMVEGTVTQWLRHEGEQVAKGEALIEVTTEKVTVEVEAAIGGLIEKILVPEGRSVPVGTPLCLIAAEGDEIPVSTGAADPAPPGRANPHSAPTAAREGPGEQGGHAPDGPAVRASGLAKRLAREKGIDLAALTGSGPGGRILEADVLRAASYQPSAISHQSSTPTTQHPELRTQNLAQHLVPGQRVPFSGARKVTADRMYRSAHDTAHVTLVAEVDATEAVGLRNQLLPEWERSAGVRLTFTDLIVKACAKALREHPALNATQVGEEIVLCEAVNLGIAVAMENALVVPVLRNADTKSLQTIAAESRQLVDRARRNALTLDDVGGGTFTVTNLGSYGIDLFTPIINPPETAILGVGRVAERPAVYNGEVCKRSLMYLSLTFDHRLVDGAPSALFMQRLRELLERPYLLLV